MDDHTVRLPRREEMVPDQRILSLMFGKEAEWAKHWEEWKEKEEDKVELFEKGLASQLHAEDTIELALKKMVKIALASEFGVSLVKSKEAQPMIEIIVRGIMSDAELRKQALAIIDRFVSPKKEIKLEKRRTKGRFPNA